MALEDDVRAWFTDAGYELEERVSQRPGELDRFAISREAFPSTRIWWTTAEAFPENREAAVAALEQQRLLVGADRAFVVVGSERPDAFAIANVSDDRSCFLTERHLALVLSRVLDSYDARDAVGPRLELLVVENGESTDARSWIAGWLDESDTSVVAVDGDFSLIHGVVVAVLRERIARFASTLDRLPLVLLDDGSAPASRHVSVRASGRLYSRGFVKRLVGGARSLSGIRVEHGEASVRRIALSLSLETVLDALAATTSLRREWSKIFEDDPPLLDAIRRSPRLRLALFAGARESKGLKPPIAALVVAFRDARPGGRRSTNETQRLNRLALRNFVLGEVEDIDPRGIEELVSKRRRGVFSAPTIEDVSLTFRHYLVAQHLVAQLRRGDDSLLVRYSIPERFVLQFARAIDPELASRFSEDRLASVRQDVARTVEREVNLTLAHQLNRAVGSLYSHVKQLRKAIGDAATLHAAESLSGIDAELRFLKRLTDQSNRLDRSHEWTLRSLELAPIIDAAIQSLQLEADKRSWIHVDVHDSHRARADEDGLREVLFCLLENAIHAVSYQTVDAAHRAVAVEVMRVDETIEIRVRDRGCGIVDEDRDRVFEPFVTTKKGGEGKPRGSGLGLTIARRYAERMNGRLVLERAHGETVFLLRLVAGE